MCGRGGGEWEGGVWRGVAVAQGGTAGRWEAWGGGGGLALGHGASARVGLPRASDAYPYALPPALPASSVINTAVS